MPPLAETLMFPFFPGFANNATTAAAVAHAAEAETAVDQPMDVSPFRQFQQLMHEKINTLRILEGPESISITNFHEVMMPIYLMSMNPDTVTNAFMEAGIHPFKRENDADVKQEAFFDEHVQHSIQTVAAHNNSKSAEDDDIFSEGELPPLDKPPPRLSCEIINLTGDLVIEVTEDDIALSSEGVTHFRAAATTAAVAHAAEAETAVDLSVSGAVVGPYWRGPTDAEVYEQLCTVACKPRRVCQCDDPDAASPFVLALLEENPDAMLLVDGDYVRMVPY